MSDLSDALFALAACHLPEPCKQSGRAVQAFQPSHTSIVPLPHKHSGAVWHPFRRIGMHNPAFYHVYSCAFLHIGCRPISCLLVAECRYCLRMAYYFVYMRIFAINNCRFDFPAAAFACGFGRVSHYLTAKMCPFASKSVFLPVKTRPAFRRHPSVGQAPNTEQEYAERTDYQ